MKQQPHHSLKCDPEIIAKHKRRIAEISQQIAKLEDLRLAHYNELQDREAKADLQSEKIVNLQLYHGRRVPTHEFLSWTRCWHLRSEQAIRSEAYKPAFMLS